MNNTSENENIGVPPNTFESASELFIMAEREDHAKFWFDNLSKLINIQFTVERPNITVNPREEIISTPPTSDLFCAISDPFEIYDQQELKPLEVSAPKNSADDVLFDIVECFVDGSKKKKLLIFTTNERKRCYEYVASNNDYQCIHHPESKIKATINDDASKSYNFDALKEHVCQPTDYSPQNYQTSLIVQSPNFKLFQRLNRGSWHPVIFVVYPTDKSLCYKYSFNVSNRVYRCIGCSNRVYRCIGCRYNNKLLSARFIQLNGNTAIELGQSEHQCEPENF
uniref:Uncharacterized protein n=1 Tax=Panagrolaimus sp. ES5 TaxID=591445 RepID=A0AC34FUZ2_9BILA